MISYDEKLKTFLINGKNFSYAMYINSTGFLQQLYYGKKLNSSDINYLVNYVGNKFQPDKNTVNWETYFDEMPSECGFFGHGDFREATVIIERDDGALLSRFRYNDYEIYDGLPVVKGMPYARGNGQTLRITLTDDFSDVKIILNYSVFSDCDVIIRNIELHNYTEKTVRIKRVYSFCLDMESGDYNFLSLSGRNADERNIESSHIYTGTYKLQSTRGASSHEVNPFIAFYKGDCNENYGEIYGVQLIYSGSFDISAFVRKNAPIRVQGGISDYCFSWKLENNEIFSTPQVVLSYSNSGLGEMSRNYCDFLREHIVNQNLVYKTRPIIINNWEMTGFDFKEEQLYALIDNGKSLGMDTFVLDDGWFGERNDDTSSLGDWTVNNYKLKNGLNGLIRYCKKNGMKFGLWIEPEMVNPDSELYREHPEFIIGKKGINPVQKRNQYVLDFSNSEVVDYIYDKVERILSENEISYVKWDMNRNITECYSASLPFDRQGEFMHRYILGVYNLAERLTSKFDNILFEGCASGGGRFDAGMLYYFPQIWTSDNTDAFERTKIQYGTSICYPLSSMSCHVSDCPNYQTGRTVPLKSRMNVASMGILGFEFDLGKLSDEEKNYIKKSIEKYKKHSDVILKGDLYRLSSPFDSNYFCEMCVSKDKKVAYVMGMQIKSITYSVIGTLIKCVKLIGLDENKNYYVEELNDIISGNVLCNIGLELPRKGDYTTWEWHLSEK